MNSRQIDTSVTVKDLQTVVLGGLITTREVIETSRVPLLGSIPLLGNFFSYESSETERVELVVFLTVAIQHENGLTDDQREMFDETSFGMFDREQPSTLKQRLAYSLPEPAY